MEQQPLVDFDEGVNPFEELPTPVMSEESAGILAFQAAASNGDLSSEQLERFQQRILYGDEPRVREELSVKRTNENKALRPKILSQALADGDADAAMAAFNSKGVYDPPETSIERGYGEFATAVKIQDKRTPVPNPEIDPKINARLAIIDNTRRRFAEMAMTKYTREDINIQRDPLFDPDATKINPGQTKMAIDILLGMIFQSDYALGKTPGSILKFFVPGHASKEIADKLNDPNISQEEWERTWNAYSRNLERSFMGEWLTNPIKLINSLDEGLFTGQYDKEFTKAITSLKHYFEYNKETGRFDAKENPLAEDTMGFLGSEGGNREKDIYDPDSTLDRMMYSPWFSDLVDNPLWDLTMLSIPRNAFRMIKATVGLEQAGRIVANSITTNAPIPHVTNLHATSLLKPGAWADPEVIAATKEQLRIQQQGFAEIVEEPRVVPSGTQLIDEGIKIRNELYNDASFAWMKPVVEGPNNFYEIHHQALSGRPFLSEAAAIADAQRRGFTDFEITDLNGNFYIKTKYSLNDNAFIDKSIDVDQRNLKERFWSRDFTNTILGQYTWWGRRAYSPNVNHPEKIAAANAGAMEVGKYAHLFERLNEPLNTLKSSEQRDLMRIIKLGQQTPNPTPTMPNNVGKWLTEEEFDAAYRTTLHRAPSIKEKKAYAAFQVNSDTVWSLLNKRMYDELVSKGFQHFTFKSGPIDFPLIAKIVHDRHAVDDDARIMVRNGRITEKKNVATTDLDDPDSLLLKVDGIMEHQGEPITHILWKRSDLETSGLSKVVMGYTEGGTRAYWNNTFVKTKIKGKIPHTLAVGTTPKAAAKLAKQYNDMLDLYKQYSKQYKQLWRGGTLNVFAAAQLRRQFDAAIQAVHSRFDVDRIDRFIVEGKLDPDYKVHALRDREAFPDPSVRGEPPLTTYQFKGRMYYSPRGEHLVDETEQLAELSNPFESLAREQALAVRIAGYGQFAIKEMQAWGSRWKNYLDTPMKIPTNEELFLHGEWKAGAKTDLSESIINQAEAQREYIGRVLRQPTTMSSAIQARKESGAKIMASLLGDAKWAKSKGIDKYLHSLTTGKILSESDALNFLKGAAYSVHLGFYQSKQLWMQGSAAFIGMRLHPVYGIEAVKDLPLIRLAASMDFNNHLVKVMDGKAAELVGYKRGEFTDILADYRRTGLHNVGATDTLQDKFAATLPLGKARKMAADANDSQRVLVYEGDRIGRIVAFGIARRKALDKVKAGEFKKFSHEYINYIRGEVQRLHIGMLSGAESWYQRNEGVALALQMKQYGFKMSEVFLGINRTFTPKEKAAIVATETIGYGLMGIPLAGEIFESVMWDEYGTRTEEEKISRNTFKRVYLGLLDTMLREGKGWDTALGAQLGTGDTFGFFKDIFNKNAPMFFLGLSGTDIVKAAQGYENVAYLFAAYNTMAPTPNIDPLFLGDDVLSEVGKIISGSNSITKAFYVQKYGVLLSANQDRLLERNTGWNSFLSAAGVMNAEEFMGWKEAQAVAKDAEFRRGASKVAAALMLDADLAFKENNFPKYDHLTAIKKGFLGVIPADDRKDVEEMAMDLLSDENFKREYKARGIFWSEK